MLAKYLAKNGGRVTARGHKVSEWVDALWLFLIFFSAFAVVGSIESGRWFG